MNSIAYENNWLKKIILFLSSQTISLFGSSLVQYAIMWHITLSSNSGGMMTIAIICGFLPTFFLSPFAGVWADRYNRKLLIILSDSMIAIATLILAILFLLGYDSLWLLFVTSVVRSFGAGIQMPAVNAFIPQMVPEDMLTKVNSINGSIQSFVTLISPMISAALLTMTTIELIFFIDVITAMIALTILLFFLQVPVHAKALQTKTGNYFVDLREGVAYIKNHDYVKRFFLFGAFFFFLAAPVAFLTPLQVIRSFGDDVWRLSAIEVVFSIGMLAGGMLMALWGGLSNRIHTMALASFATGVFTFFLGSVPYFWIYLLFMGLTGIAMPIFNIPATVLLQEKVEGDYLGRVFGVLIMISTSMMPIGMLVFGPIADLIKIEWLLIGTGLLMSVESFFLLGSKVLLEAGKAKH